MADNILYHFFYSSSSMLDNDHMQLGPLTIETNTMKRIYMFYIKTDLVYDYELEKYYDDPDNLVCRIEMFIKDSSAYSQGYLFLFNSLMILYLWSAT
jgi:hypothetical protein